MKTRIALVFVALLDLVWIVVQPILLKIPPLELLRLGLIWLDIPFAVWLLSAFRTGYTKGRHS